MYTSNISELTVNEILLRVDELDIFSYYIPKLELGRTINSPLRKDKRPSFVVFNSKATKRRVLYKDFATGDTGSCFDLVMQMYGVNLVGSLKIIDKDLNIGLSSGVAKPKRVMQHHYKPIEQSETIIEITSRKWNAREDKDFWSQYNIHASTLQNFGVHPVKYVWINGDIVTTHKRNNPIYGYQFYKDSKYTWKIYQPYNTEFKWLSNTNKSILQGWDQLPYDDEVLIITKSLKDVMCLYEMGIAAIAPQSESQDLKGVVLEQLKRRFKYIYVFFDNDDVGQAQSKRFSDINELPRFEIAQRYMCKDISDFIKKYDIDQAKELLNIHLNI